MGLALTPVYAQTQDQAVSTYSQAQDLSSPDRQDSTTRHAIVALKNNLLYDAMATPNLQLEFRLADHWTLQAGVGFNPFPLDDKTFPKWRHVHAEIAPRYWFCGAYTRDFVSVNVGYAHYNVAGGTYPLGWIYKEIKNNRFQGDALLMGASYGWQFPITKHFGIELEAGVDAGLTWFDQFTCKHCGEKVADKQRKWFAVPRLGVNLVVLLDDNAKDFEDRCDCGKLSPVSYEYEEEVLDEVVEEVADTVQDVIAVVPIDTVVVADTIVPVIADTILEAPVDTLSEQVNNDQSYRRMRAAILCPIAEFVPYDATARVMSEPKGITMHFAVGKATIDRAYFENDKQMDSITRVLTVVLQDTTIAIKQIRIVGMASFDGPLKANIRLAQSRADALRDYLQQRFDLPEEIYQVYNGGENWQELRWYLDQETFPNKEQVLQAIDKEPDLEKREQQIKRIGQGGTYEYMKTHFNHYLRRLGTITVYYEDKQ